MSSSAKNLSSDQSLPRPSPKDQLIASLERLVQNFPPNFLQPHGGFFYGPTSIALLFFTLSKHYPDDLKIFNRSLQAWFTAYFSSLPDPLRSGSGSDGHHLSSSNHCGVMEDQLSHLSLQAAAYSDKQAANKLCDLATIALTPGVSDEWLYGRAGFLYHLRLAKSGFPGNNPDHRKILDRINHAAQAVITAILDAPQPWSWHGKVYVGAVHGIIGIITQVVLTEPAQAARVERLLDSLLRTQYGESGNWPSSLPAGRDRLVQVCHGAPGVVVSLVGIRKYFPGLDGRIGEAVATGREVIKRRGLLLGKEPCLCHGVSGNALALGEGDLEEFLAYAVEERFEQLIEARTMEPSSHPDGLWTGEAGRAWACAVADKGLARGLLGYNDL